MSSTWSNLAKVVYRRTYARKDTGTLENWPQTVERVIGGNVRNHNVSEDEINQLRYYLTERKAGPAGRGWWFSGAPAHAIIGGVALNNCFSGETRFWANGKLTRLDEAIGQTVGVIGRDGKTYPAQVQSFGVQSLHTIRLKVQKNSGFTLQYVATANHRWITSNRGEVTDLRPGDRILVTPTKPNKASLAFARGFVHGFVFGDGTQHTYYPDRFMVRLCGAKAQYLSKMEEDYRYVSTASHPSSENEPIVTLRTTTNLKEVPKSDSPLDYQAGFLEGWRAADGSTRGRLCSQDPTAMEWLIERAPQLGVCIVGDTSQNNITNYGPRSAPCRSLTLKEEPTEYKVTEIADSGRKEEVYCVVEPKTHTFTLEGGVVTGNCWFTTSEDWANFVLAQDLLMLGGGVGLTVEHRYTSKLPRVKKNVVVVHKATKDADFIVPDSREGWCELTRRVLEAFFVTGKSFCFSTVCVRGAGEFIKGFGGSASGPLPLIAFVEKLSKLLVSREGKTIRPIDAADILCAIGELVVSGNVRRSALILLGDAWDKDYLRAKRWDLGAIPTQRAMGNWSVVCDDIEDLHPLFWKTYEQGEAFGIVNRSNIQKYARIGVLRKDSAIGVNPCGESCLEGGAKFAEPCNLQNIALPNLDGPFEFEQASRLMHRWGKRVTMEQYHHEGIEEVIKRNRRIGTSITGCLRSPLFCPDELDKAYAAIEDENRSYSKEKGIPESIRLTTLNPGGTFSKMYGMVGYEGVHAAFSRYIIQRIRFATSDTLVDKLAAAGHHVEPVVRFDGTLDRNTSVVDFYERAPDGYPVADEDWSTWKQLDVVKMAQAHWADQSVSVTVYYRKEEIPLLKAWLADNLKYLKTISFLCHNDHGFKQAPKQAITKEEYERLSATVKPIDADEINSGDLESLECSSGACPIK